jgi:histidine triad (HIT) family protein
MSLDGDYDPDNVFARMLRGEIPAAKVFEDGEVFAFLDLFPQSRGHTLVISKISRARNILEVEPFALEKLIQGVQRIARALKAALNPDGIVVTQFNGAAAGQSVFHLHFHVIPRYAGQALAGHGASGMADSGELAELARKIAAAIS